MVDAAADIRETLRDAREDEGYTVAVSADGAEALRLLGQVDPPGVVILDSCWG